MKILHIITRLIAGGAQQNTVASCRAQRAAGHEVWLVHGPVYGPEGSLEAEADESGATRIVVPTLHRAVSPWRDWRACRALRRLIRDIRPDIVHTHSSKAGILGRAAAWKERQSRGGLPPRPGVIHTVHGLPFNDRQPALKRRAYIAAERWAAKRCHRLIAITHAMADAFVENQIAPREKFTIIPSGVNVAFWSAPSVAARGLATSTLVTSDSKLRRSTRADLDIPDDSPLIALVARLDPLKGHADLIDIAPQLIAAHPDLRILFVGDGYHREQIVQQLRAAGIVDRVTMTGLVPLERMPALYRAADVCILPSYQEGQSRVLVEALLCNCPIVAYDAGGIGEVCIEGKTGRLVPVGDKNALAAALAWTLDHPEDARRLAAAGRAYVAERFDERVMVKRLQELYDAAIQSRKPENQQSKPGAS